MIQRQQKVLPQEEHDFQKPNWSRQMVIDEL
jgi:hypothetical protein